MSVMYRTQKVDDVEIFYREAGPPGAPVILLLHGYPTASHMFRDLIPTLASEFRVIAPDLPGFGLTQAPPRGVSTPRSTISRVRRTASLMRSD